MLAVAYALDLQPDAAVKHVRLVRGSAETDGRPGWEDIALAIACMLQDRPQEAVVHLQRPLSAAPRGPGVRAAAHQWLTLALLLGGDCQAAQTSLSDRAGDAKSPAARTTALLWSVLVHGYRRKGPEATMALSKVGAHVLGQRRAKSIEFKDVTKADDRDICDAGMAAIRDGDLARAEAMFAVLHGRNANACDSQVWLALISATRGQWSRLRERLKNACEEGPIGSRGLSNQLFSVVCALEGRPRDMVHHLLAGCRLAGRNRLPPA